jgi:Common central domain of tyrosinase/Polyphenol oxidase middle domain
MATRPDYEKSGSNGEEEPVMHVRRNVSALRPGGARIRALKDGVRAMKDTSAFPNNDPRSWAYQAAIHGSNRRPPDPQAQDSWNMCQHASFFFLSWHRMYIYFFERILRAASGDPNLALPYWNYSDPAQRALPVPFREPSGAANPLYVSQRNAGINAGAELLGSDVSTTQMFLARNFLPREGSRLSFGGGRVPGPVHFSSFTGLLEAQPHNTVHVKVGGWMGDPNTAAQDPIFWLHHANIDRLWERWLDRGEGRANPVNNGVWMDTEFAFFDEDGDQVEMSAREIIQTSSQLDYVYDDEPAGALGATGFSGAAARVGGAEVFVATSSVANGDAEEPTLIGRTRGRGEGEMIELGAEPTRVAVELGAPAAAAAEMVEAQAAARVAGEQAPEGGEEQRIVLGLDGVQYDESPGVTYEIYLNLPEGQQPDYTSDYYVGNLGFFGMEAGGHGEGAHGHPANLSFDVTDNVRALRAKGEWHEREANVSFFARGLIPPPGEETSVAEAEARAASDTAEPAGSPRVERVVFSVE